MNFPHIPAGTKLSVLGPWPHEGLYVGPQGDGGEDVHHADRVTGVVRLSRFEDFAGGWPVEVEVPATVEEGEARAQRAMEHADALDSRETVSRS